MGELEVHLATVLAKFGAEMAKVVRYSLVSNQRTTRLAALIITVMIGLHYLR